jgi:hypothetical protein
MAAFQQPPWAETRHGSKSDPCSKLPSRRSAWVGSEPTHAVCWTPSSTANTAAASGTRCQRHTPTTARPTERTNAGDVWVSSINCWTYSRRDHPAATGLGVSRVDLRPQDSNSWGLIAMEPEMMVPLTLPRPLIWTRPEALLCLSRCDLVESRAVIGPRRAHIVNVGRRGFNDEEGRSDSRTAR